MARFCRVWDIPNMNDRSLKKLAAEQRAKDLAERFSAIRPDELSERQLCLKAGVSLSFFSNLRGAGKKPPSEPTIGNVRDVLRVLGTTIPEFFIEEARGRVIAIPAKKKLEEVLAGALENLPRRVDRRPAYLASVVLRALELPEAGQANLENQLTFEPDDGDKGVAVHLPTNRA